MTFRFLHAADLHLDTPFSGVAASESKVAPVLRDASLDAFDALVRLAIARDVAFVILAGDLYDGSVRGLRAQLELHRGLQELSARGIQTFVVAGNHDPVDEGWSAVAGWPDLVTFFPSEEAASVVVERDGRAVATVHGISYGRRDVTENLAARIVPDDGPRPQIAVLHANVDANPHHEDQSPCSLDDLVDAGIDYWALGHVHMAGILHRHPWVVYPGTVQARHRGPSDQGPKGAYLVEVDDAGTIGEPEFVALDVVRFDWSEQSIDGLVDVAQLRDRLIDLGRARLAEVADRSVLLTVGLTGRGPLHGELHRPGSIPELLDALRAESLSEPPFLWWERIELATSPLQDLDELQGRNDFVADLVDETQRLLVADEARSRRVAGWDDELPSDLAHLLGGELPDAADPGRWTGAQELAIGLVASDEA